jgi:hypothetical protein
MKRFHHDWKRRVYLPTVMAGRVPAICAGTVEGWMVGTRPAMTVGGDFSQGDSALDKQKPEKRND